LETDSPLADSRNHKTYYFVETPTRRIVIFIIRLVFKLIADIQVVGLENLPKEGAVIIAANHLSNFDAFQLQVSLPRPIFFLLQWRVHL